MSGDEYRTPPELFRQLNEITPFFWDGCCNKDNCLVSWQKEMLKTSISELNVEPYNYLLEDMSQFKEEHNNQSIFINPPYSRGKIKAIINKAYEDAKHFMVVLLLKADMSTNWLNDILDQADTITLGRQGPYTLEESIKAIIDEMRWHPHKGNESCVGILFLRKRVKFHEKQGKPAKSGANFPSLILILDRRKTKG